MSLLFQTKLCNSEKKYHTGDSVGPAYYIIDKAIFMKWVDDWWGTCEMMHMKEIFVQDAW